MAGDQNSNPYEFSEYQLPIKQKWSCGYSQYAVITWVLAFAIGIIAATCFSKWFFRDIHYAIETPTISTVFYLIIFLVAPVGLFLSCLLACKKTNRQLRAEKNLFQIEDIGKALQQIIIACLKCSLFFLLCEILVPPAVIILCLIVGIRTIRKVFCFP